MPAVEIREERVQEDKLGVGRLPDQEVGQPLFPDFDRRDLWRVCEIYASRDRRYGGAVPNPLPALPDGLDPRDHEQGHDRGHAL